MTLEEALEAGPSARLEVVGRVLVQVTQDLDGECAVYVRQSGGAQVAQRFSTVAEVRAYLASGVVPGVRGDERGWVV